MEMVVIQHRFKTPPRLVILYGKFGSQLHQKQQAMIDGGPSCGYRDYARLFGEIIYLCPQVTHLPWEKSINDHKKLVQYLNAQDDIIVWSVKHDPKKDQVLKACKHPTLYYSCCAYDTICNAADYSLVDIQERILPGTNAVLWQKGKDEEKWNYDPNVERVYDYVLMGKRADKNEIWFIEQLTKTVKEPRKILWIGGLKHVKKVNAINSHHQISITHFCDEKTVISCLNKCKVHVLLSEHPAEGFPQSLIESGMMGCACCYFGPNSKKYSTKKDAFSGCENILKTYDYVFHQGKSQKIVRDYNVYDFSIHKSWEQMQGYFK